jgi:hypothetical protein
VRRNKATIRHRRWRRVALDQGREGGASASAGDSFTKPWRRLERIARLVRRAGALRRAERPGD